MITVLLVAAVVVLPIALVFAPFAIAGVLVAVAGSGETGITRPIHPHRRQDPSASTH